MGGVAVLHPQDCLADNLFLTPVKSRRTPKSNPNLLDSNSTPNSTRSDGRKRSPPTGVRKNKSMVTDPPSAAAKTLVMGQVKILKRGEPLDESVTVSNNSNGRNVTNAAATTATKAVAVDRKLSRVTPAKKKSEKEKRNPQNSNPKIATLKIDDFALSSTNRLGPDPEMVPKQMNKNIADFFFAGSAFVDSPPPSSLPLPGFFTKSFTGAAVKEDPSTDLRRILGLSI